MKRKIISYLLVGLFALFIGGYSFMYVDAGDGQQDKYLADSNYSDSDDNLSAGSNASMAPAGEGASAGGQTSSSTKPKDSCPDGCCGIKLNTNFPIIGNCIETKAGAKTDPTNAFPYMLGVFTKIIMSVILVVCFILIIVAGIMWASSGDKAPSKAKELIKKVAITILLLGLSGLILKLINPNFFG